MPGTEKFGQLGSFCILDLAALDISGEFCVLIGRLFWRTRWVYLVLLPALLTQENIWCKLVVLFQYPPSLISHLVNIADLLYISFFKSVRSLCHLLCCCIKSLSRPQLMCKLDFIIVQELIIFVYLLISLSILSPSTNA